MRMLTLWLCAVICLPLAGQSYRVDTLKWTGSGDNRINIVILGDGYRAEEMDQFAVDAVEFVEALFAEPPFLSYHEYFNVLLVETPSRESGASHPGTATDVEEPYHPVSEVDNFYGSTFDYLGIHRLLAIPDTRALVQVVATTVPDYDKLFMLVNSPYYGGSGFAVPVASLARQSKEISLHEIGHSFAGLLDEYYAGNKYAREGINMSKWSNPEKVGWKEWVGKGDVGVFQHCCGGISASWYRPHEECKMRYLGRPFCVVCREAIVQNVFALVSPVDTYDPLELTQLDPPDGKVFRVGTVRPIPNTLDVIWQLNGATIASGTDSVVLTSSNLKSGQNTLQVTVSDVTDFLSPGMLRQTNQATIAWQIDASTVSVSPAARADVNLTLLPNPVATELRVVYTSTSWDPTVARVHGSTGRLMLTKKIQPGEREVFIDVAGLAGGSYFLTLTSASGVRVSMPFVKH